MNLQTIDSPNKAGNDINSTIDEKNLQLLKKKMFSYSFTSVLTVMNLFIVLFLISPHAKASVNVDLHDDVYDVLSRLEAEGVIQSGLLTTRPLSRNEIKRLIREAESNSEGRSEFIRQLIESLKERFQGGTDHVTYFKPFQSTYAVYAYADSPEVERITYNNDGFSYEEGSNFKFGISAEAAFERISLYFNPEVRLSDGKSDVVAQKAYGIFHIAGLALELGKDSQWWGPGHHGSLLVSDNPEPLTMLKVTNPKPVILPSIFRHLGLFKFNFFVTRLEEDRAVPNPYLWGLRIVFKPNPYLDAGLQRTALLGGEGRSEDLKTWLKSFTGKDENKAGVEAGDQRAGLDITLTLPLAYQPLQVYAEAAGEDEAGGLPSKWAYLTGLYFPRIGSLEFLEFRAEYAINSVGNWYNHHIYRSGYTYKGRIIGHHMGTDSKDIFTELRYYFPGMRIGHASIAYDREEHNLSGNVHETEDEAIIKIHLSLNSSTSLRTEYRFGKLKNFDNTRGVNREIHVLTAAVTHEF